MSENIFSFRKLEDSSDLQKISELESKIASLEKKLQVLTTVARQPIIIENMYIRRIDTDDFQFKLESIDVKELSGMLNVGINSGGKFYKKEHKKKPKS